MLCIGGAFAIGIVTVGVANTRTITDPEGDVPAGIGGNKNNVDITAASAGHAKKALKHTVTVKGKVDAAAPPKIFVNKKPSDSSCDFFVGVVTGQGAGVYKCSGGKKVGSATIVAISDTTLRFTFKPGSVGKPNKYFWAAQFEQGDTLLDRAPDSGMIKHKLR
jgi:hypothetical protein